MLRKLFAALLFACLTCTLLATASAQPAAAAYSQKPEILPSAASAPPADATGLTGQKLDWKVGAAPQWIWGEDQNKKYIVRKTFTAGGKAAVLRATCDNRLILWLTGKQIAEDNDWEAPVEVDIQKLLKPGENLLEAEIDNQGGPAAFVLKLILTGEDGKPTYVVSDDTWQIAESRTATAWGKPNIVAAYGSQPWGAALSADVGGGSSGEQFSLLPGFQIERLFTVPKAECGSWVCLTTDAQGRLIASDQDNKGLYRITPSPIGSDQPTQVERLSVKMTSAQGLLYADGSLYVSANGGPGSGLYRLRDTNGDDQYDEVVKLAEFRGGGEHGPHALRLSPDGKSIYVVCGNHTRPPFDVKLNAPPQTMGGARAEQLRAEIPAGMSSRIAPNWDEDLLLPRQWDGNGHAAGILAPGGWIARTDLNGKSWEIMSIGFRNQYDFALNADGEIFAYDADMEWDFGSPWYRPTRVVHATSGSEFGWRSGTGKWPTDRKSTRLNSSHRH